MRVVGPFLLTVLVLAVDVADAATRSVSAERREQAATTTPRAQMATEPKGPTEEDRDLETLLVLVRSAGPEFRVDGLLRLAGALKETNKRAVRVLLEEAFDAIPAVNAPIRMYATTMGAEAVEGLLGPAENLGFDRLSFETRAIKLLADLDLPEAGRRFLLVTPDISAEDCALPRVADWSSYYETARYLLSKGPTPNASRELWQHLIQTMRSPGQIRPMVTLVNASEARALGSPHERAMQFIVALNNVLGNDRSFSANTWVDISAIRLLAFNVRFEDPVGLLSLFMPAVREYVVRHAQMARCEDSVKSSRTVRPTDAHRVTQILCQDLPKCTLSVSELSLRPSRLLPGPAVGAKDQVFWQTPESAQLLRRIRHLRFGPPTGKAQPPERDRTSRDWQIEYDEVVPLVAGWAGLREASRRIFLAEKVMLSRALLSLAPDDRRRALAVARLSDVLTVAEQETLTPTEWYVFAREIVTIAGQKESTEASDAAAAFIAKHPALRMYQSLQEFLSRRSRAGAPTDRNTSTRSKGGQ